MKAAASLPAGVIAWNIMQTASPALAFSWGRKAVMDLLSFQSKASIAVQMSRVRSSHFYLGTLFGNMEPVSKGASRICGNTGVGGLVVQGIFSNTDLLRSRNWHLG